MEQQCHPLLSPPLFHYFFILYAVIVYSSSLFIYFIGDASKNGSFSPSGAGDAQNETASLQQLTPVRSPVTSPGAKGQASSSPLIGHAHTNSECPFALCYFAYQSQQQQQQQSQGQGQHTIKGRGQRRSPRKASTSKGGACCSSQRSPALTQLMSPPTSHALSPGAPGTPPASPARRVQQVNAALNISLARGYHAYVSLSVVAQILLRVRYDVARQRFIDDAHGLSRAARLAVL